MWIIQPLTGNHMFAEQSPVQAPFVPSVVSGSHFPSPGPGLTALMNLTLPAWIGDPGSSPSAFPSRPWGDPSPPEAEPSPALFFSSPSQLPKLPWPCSSAYHTPTGVSCFSRESSCCVHLHLEKERKF